MHIYVGDAFSGLLASPITSVLALISIYVLGIAWSSAKIRNPWKKWIESDKNLHFFIKTVREPIIIIDHGRKAAYWNPAAERLFGYTEAEILGEDVGRILALDRYEDYERGLQSIKKTKGGDAFGEVLKLKALTKSGKKIPVELSLSPMELEGRVGAVAVIRDISGRKKMEQQLKDSQQMLTNALEALNIGSCLTKNRTIFWVNNSFAKMLGYAPGELVGKSTKTIYKTKEEFERVGSTLNLLGPEETVIEQEIRLLRKDGSLIDCLFRAALLQPCSSKERIIISMVEDITEKKTLEAQLNQAQKMEAVGILAGGVAHDFNNILTTIMGNVELALMDLDGDSSFKTYLDEILKASRRGASLTKQLLAFSRKQIVQPRPLNLNEVIKDLEKMLERLIGEDIDLIIHYGHDLGNIEADPGQMQQIVMNLAVNARDAMPKGGTLTITTENVELDEKYFFRRGLELRPGPYVRLAISDTGMGMDEATKMRLFEPFFTTKGLQKGTGLGLSTVYGIVKQNKGYIWVSSELGKGSIFDIYLPRTDRKSWIIREDRPPLGLLQGTENILLVEDDEGLRETTAEMLRIQGYRVIKTKSGKEALEVLAQLKESIDLMLTDIVMPGMSGKELAETVRQKFPKIKIIVMSGYAGEILANHGILEQQWDFIQKPFTGETLTRKIREALESGRDSDHASRN